MVMDLDAARQEIQSLDEAILEACARRIAIARDVAHAKADSGKATVDFAQERRVRDRAAAKAVELGIDPGIVQRLMDQLIEASVTVQEDERLELHASGAGRSAVVIGGEGRMGRWLVRFLAAQSYAVDVIEEHGDWLIDHDLIIVATPPAEIAGIYRRLQQDPPRGVVCDVASIKAPFADEVARLQAAGVRVASIHPMFGPDARLLRGLDVVICDTGDAEAEAVVRGLFASTAARLVPVPFDGHDQWMADVLALSHAAAISFAAALPEEPTPISSKTLGALVDVAGSAVRESPRVYYEIQAHNPHAAKAVARLGDSLQRLQDAVAAQDPDRFERIMEDGAARTRSP